MLKISHPSVSNYHVNFMILPDFVGGIFISLWNDLNESIIKVNKHRQYLLKNY
jgi:hypothetical protein